MHISISELFNKKNNKAIEQVLAETSGKYCVGDSVTLADCYLVPQLDYAKRFKVDVSKYKTIQRINDELLKLPAFQKAHACNQPDTPEEERSKK